MHAGVAAPWSHEGSQRPLFSGGVGVLFGCFGRQVDGDSWFTWWFNHPGPSISPKRIPMSGGVGQVPSLRVPATAVAGLKAPQDAPKAPC